MSGGNFSINDRLFTTEKSERGLKINMEVFFHKLWRHEQTSLKEWMGHEIRSTQLTVPNNKKGPH